ncbi:Spermidine/putrescine-binding periplasmic protein precursor [Nocardioides dokdonensis FR1436]|uniref:Spermidine/putrescine-binding periplasmic protein n=1 Tax=Nocardioides dokdonensis FR1436 TaxID=1300347 RepID=A0A1A9GL96_9ACTN|nr:ABC transporter substrate-binding protein [Nocardioides dokdonensis]ANH38241.1 Spermidine/putrescine-binding periplasmic protein precursor [Nocardioides dokdonensis FR1436]
MRLSPRPLAMAAVGLLAVTVTACGGSSAEDGESLTVVMWGGSAQSAHVDSYVAPWAEENGVEVLQDQPTDYAKLRAQVESGKVSWGVVEAEPNFTVTACEDGLLEKIDTSVVDTSALDPQFVNDCAIPNLQYAFTISYNTDVFPDAHPTTWAEFFDTEEFPGKRGFWRYATGGIFEAALLADGVAAEDLYPLDIDRAFAKLDTIKDDIVFYDTGDQQVQLLASGEAPLVQAWNGRVFDAVKQGQPVANEFGEHLLSYDQIAIPKGYPNADLAMEWMGHFVEDLEGQAADADATAYSPVNPAALDLVADDVLPQLPTAPENDDSRAIVIDYTYWAENYDAVSERFNEWLAK